MQNTPTFFRLLFLRAKKQFSVLIILLASYATLRADAVTVHHIGVGQGDATLIIALQGNGAGFDTTTILIDAGNSSGKGLAVFNYLDEFLGTTKHLNYIITSHLHSDHIGGMPNLLLQLHNNGWTVDYILDRGATMQPLADSCYSTVGFVDNDTVQPADLPGSQVYKKYEDAVNDYYPNRRYNPTAGVDLFRELGRGPNMSMLMVASQGCVLTSYGSTVYECPDNRRPDENDLSYGFLFTFESFRYFTAGDLGGKAPYLDLETPLVTYFKTYPDPVDFHFCAYKASHHGSDNSNMPHFVQNTLPTLTVVPSALRSFSGTQLPGQRTINTLTDVGSHMFYTYVYDAQPYSGTISAFRDIVFHVIDPGYGKDIVMALLYRDRSKTSPYAPVGDFVQSADVTCLKEHDAPTLVSFSNMPSTEIAPGNTVTVITPNPANISSTKSRRLKRIKRKINRLEQKEAELQGK